MFCIDAVQECMVFHFSRYKGGQVEGMATGFDRSDNHRSIWNRTVGMGKHFGVLVAPKRSSIPF